MRSIPLTSSDHQKHVPFTAMAPYLRTALLLGSGGGFALACILTLAPLLGIPLGSWWAATVQVHGHLQLFGWAGLFVVGVALYFLPRLQGAPLERAYLLPWILTLQIVSLLLRCIGQPFFIINRWPIWSALLMISGILEALALFAIFLLLMHNSIRKPTTRSTVEGTYSIAPFILGAFLGLALAGILNFVNCLLIVTHNSGLVPDNWDQINTALGLFGFLTPVALAVSSRMLPLYVHIQPFPSLLLRILALSYFAGIILWQISPFLPGSLPSPLNGVGFFLVGAVILIFISYFLHLIRNRTHIPSQTVANTIQASHQTERIQQHRQKEREQYGPYVALIGSAYLWGFLGALLLLIDGIALLLFGTQPIMIDAIRHCFAVGFITLLICGIAVRMLPGFSGKTIRSAHFVSATLILGNLATFLRVCPLLFPSTFPGSSILFAFSGPLGLALILCLTINLWPTLSLSIPSITMKKGK